MDNGLAIGLIVAGVAFVASVVAGVMGYSVKRNIEQVDSNLEIVAGVGRQLEIATADWKSRIEKLEGDAKWYRDRWTETNTGLNKHIQDDEHRITALEASSGGGDRGTGRGGSRS